MALNVRKSAWSRANEWQSFSSLQVSRSFQEERTKKEKTWESSTEKEKKRDGYLEIVAPPPSTHSENYCIRRKDGREEFSASEENGAMFWEREEESGRSQEVDHYQWWLPSGTTTSNWDDHKDQKMVKMRNDEKFEEWWNVIETTATTLISF